MKRDTTHYVKWSHDGRRHQTSIIDHASALLCRTTIILGDGKEIPCKPGKLLGHEWKTEEQVKRSIDLSHIRPGAREDVQAAFTGMVFDIEGDNLRLRLRAYARHSGESFPGENLPAGQMRLRVEDALERKLVFNELMDMIKGRPIPPKLPEEGGK
jgi:hypothetical protein